MVECFLLLGHGAGAMWIPLIAIPAVIAGVAASIRLILSGLWGIVAPRRRSRSRARARLGRTVLTLTLRSP
jgi:hypothetical protein